MDKIKKEKKLEILNNKYNIFRSDMNIKNKYFGEKQNTVRQQEEHQARQLKNDKLKRIKTTKIPQKLEREKINRKVNKGKEKANV